MAISAAFKKKWVAALRSGKFEQGHGALVDSSGHYCCLGVACHLLGVDDREMSSAECISTDHSYGRRWLVPIGLKIQTAELLADGMNDSGASFADIADYIEKRIGPRAA